MSLLNSGKTSWVLLIKVICYATRKISVFLCHTVCVVLWRTASSGEVKNLRLSAATRRFGVKHRGGLCFDKHTV
jgi:hypothetical protein